MNDNKGLHRTVIALGFVSLLMDLSSETIHSLLPLFMVNILGLTAIAVGLIDGAAEALTLFFKPVSGWLSDRFRQRKNLTTIGYALAAVTKPLFAIAQGLGLIVTARFVDRIGKGIRGAPRDALIADITPSALRGRAYGLRQAMDTVGALLGPIMAALLMWWLHNNYRLVFWLAAVPAFLAVLVLWLAVKEPAQTARPSTHKTSPEAGKFPDAFWRIVLIAGVIALARPSEAFLLLRGQSLGLSESETPLLLAVMNVVYALSVYPVGAWFDRIGPQRLLQISVLFLLLAMLVLRISDGTTTAWLGAGLWGLHLGCSQGVLAALISLHAPLLKRGTAFGIYALIMGAILIGNGAIMGLLWQYFSPTIAYGFASIMSVLALLVCWRMRLPTLSDATKSI